VGILLLVLGWFVFFDGALPWAAYLMGTPATATIDHCASPTWWTGWHETCHGTWIIRGESHTGPISGGPGEPVGSPVDVHLDHDSKNGPATPYTARAESLNYYPMFGGLFLAVAGVVLWWSARRKIKTGSWPWSRRRA
jgi:hypothetical protein